MQLCSCYHCWDEEIDLEELQQVMRLSRLISLWRWTIILKIFEEMNSDFEYHDSEEEADLRKCRNRSINSSAWAWKLRYHDRVEKMNTNIDDQWRTERGTKRENRGKEREMKSLNNSVFLFYSTWYLRV